MMLKETRDELNLTRQKYNSEIAALEDGLSKTSGDLEVEREAASQLSKELQAREEHIQLSTAECETLHEQLTQKLEEISVLEDQGRLMRVEISERESRENQAQNMVRCHRFLLVFASKCSYTVEFIYLSYNVIL